ncbi:MAG: hypothetical protein MZW92_19680 [Comamonadaceae bacterium]|nr:hypothetical protein [Comamonadaceae bacterium]
MRDAAAAAGGHAHAVPRRRQERRRVRAADAPLARIHRELKRAFDPDGVFNPGRLYPGPDP